MSPFEHWPCFNIDVSIRDSFPLFTKDDRKLKRITTSPFWHLRNPYTVLADPFLFVHKDTLFLFFEAKRYLDDGVIQMVSTQDLVHWSKPQTVLEEHGIHLSYPFVFEDCGNIYMIPETGADHSIRLYKATDDHFSSFVLEKKLMDRTDGFENIKYDYADSSILRKDGLYYLITSYHTGTTYKAEIYCSKDLFGEYVPFQNNPICESLKYGRCGGGFVEKDGKIYRVTQDCEGGYGENVHLMEVDELTKDSYKEHLAIQNCLPGNLHPFELGGHQISVVSFLGKIVVAADYRTRKSFFVPKIIKKLERLLF